VSGEELGVLTIESPFRLFNKLEDTTYARWLRGYRVLKASQHSLGGQPFTQFTPPPYPLGPPTPFGLRSNPWDMYECVSQHLKEPINSEPASVSHLFRPEDAKTRPAIPTEPVHRNCAGSSRPLRGVLAALCPKSQKSARANHFSQAHDRTRSAAHRNTSSTPKRNPCRVRAQLALRLVDRNQTLLERLSAGGWAYVTQAEALRSALPS